MNSRLLRLVWIAILALGLAAAAPTAPRQRSVSFCQRSYCDDVGVRCVNVGSGKCPHCQYTCGPDPTCLGTDPLPTCP